MIDRWFVTTVCEKKGVYIIYNYEGTKEPVALARSRLKKHTLNGSPLSVRRLPSNAHEAWRPAPALLRTCTQLSAP